MAFGLYVMQNGSVMVAYGQRQIPISCAQYKANGYKPALEKLAVKSPLRTSKRSARPALISPLVAIVGRSSRMSKTTIVADSLLPPYTGISRRGQVGRAPTKSLISVTTL